mgnify:CR=1 FL=1|jgi:hypothetical protein
MIPVDVEVVQIHETVLQDLVEAFVEPASLPEHPVGRVIHSRCCLNYRCGIQTSRHDRGHVVAVFHRSPQNVVRHAPRRDIELCFVRALTPSTRELTLVGRNPDEVDSHAFESFPELPKTLRSFTSFQRIESRFHDTRVELFLDHADDPLKVRLLLHLMSVSGNRGTVDEHCHFSSRHFSSSLTRHVVATRPEI